MNSLQFLLYTLINVFCFVLFLRMWFQFCRVDFYNPLSQTLVKITQPVLSPLQKIIPTVKNINLAAILLIIVLGALKYPLLNAIGTPVMATSVENYAIIGVLHAVRTAGEALLYILFIGAIMSWFNRGANPLQYTLNQLSEPLLAPIRRILPNTGMIDFSPMLLAFVLFYGNRVLYDLLGQFWALA
ncbi:YggT family protein [Caviibacterium pharyngocola]|uniref:YggT family protein n=1 Tax=Caviibacterium pharyngocola TaxID=28159 RepID=A0A2M8RUJ2_9PAST|nr:YggT family protein [Caviibacterium pharyngocola]PJG82547.1 hypothetical protein CVP04_08815 [Caviibacterium pharyngocola]